MKTIVAVTLNPAIDKSSSVDHVVAERKLYCKTPRFEPGGGAVNVSRAIKKLGGQSLLLYPAGGLTGKRLQELLDEEGLNHRPCPIAGVIRESLVILEESTGQQYRFGMPGPRLSRQEQELFIRQLTSIGPPPDYVVASGSLPLDVPPDFYARIAHFGKKSGAKVIIDVSGEALNAALQEGVFLIKPNIREFRELAGKEIKEESQILAAARKMVEDGRCEVLVISLGAAGALVVSEKYTEHILPPTVPIVSKVGAGDSMVAGIVLSLARGNSLRESVIFGVATGTAAVMTPGTELCRREDVQRLYAGMISGA
ncbi:1-phosphofructokinase family hexose kinase [Desulfopila sp. IMCC35006]|uniref:1-phosphofructokinase family hexose kinase n=1 Tax=Desulfopila sp. IMCC35006 TaxID=2569542 RepID=UPI0010AC6AE4|nr:1-phosphofructokinase family hexose kinase [Desulfopila sp. IMCC35006]TKB24607.1 1-phosphofructokinase family hexose kinase [Desulfopila sp. IMCC35006]